VRIPATVGTSDKPYSLSLKEWLDRQDTENYSGPCERKNDEYDKALRALRAVVELHSRRTSTGACAECLGGNSDEPCATRRAAELLTP
jgi:hypothetical protein